MKQDETRRRLIDGTIRVIAEDGLDKATTKQIGTITSTNEAYIYRCFRDKEDMFAKTFASLDEELFSKAMLHFAIMDAKDMEFQARCWAYFSAVWTFILGNRDKCLTFIRYYYSPYFRRYSTDEHKARYEPLVEKFKAAFREEANVWMILNHIMATLLDFAIKVYDGAVPDDEDTAEHVFRLIYTSTKQYFKQGVLTA